MLWYMPQRSFSVTLTYMYVPQNCVYWVWSVFDTIMKCPLMTVINRWKQTRLWTSFQSNYTHIKSRYCFTDRPIQHFLHTIIHLVWSSRLYLQILYDFVKLRQTSNYCICKKNVAHTLLPRCSHRLTTHWVRSTNRIVRWSEKPLRPIFPVHGVIL
jgi:hypothetical protein